MLLPIILLLSCILDVILIIVLSRLIKEYKFYRNRYSSSVKGRIIDYKRRKHSLNVQKSRQVLYHPIVKYKYLGNTYKSMTDVGYAEEYYRVGSRVYVYCDELNPANIKLEGEVKYELKVITTAISLVVVILAQLLLVLI